jgi:hypothetical protein
MMKAKRSIPIRKGQVRVASRYWEAVDRANRKEVSETGEWMGMILDLIRDMSEDQGHMDTSF